MSDQEEDIKCHINSFDELSDMIVDIIKDSKVDIKEAITSGDVEGGKMVMNLTIEMAKAKASANAVKEVVGLLTDIRDEIIFLRSDIEESKNE